MESSQGNDVNNDTDSNTKEKDSMSFTYMDPGELLNDTDSDVIDGTKENDFMFANYMEAEELLNDFTIKTFLDGYEYSKNVEGAGVSDYEEYIKSLNTPVTLYCLRQLPINTNYLRSKSYLIGILFNIFRIDSVIGCTSTLFIPDDTEKEDDTEKRMIQKKRMNNHPCIC